MDARDGTQALSKHLHVLNWLSVLPASDSRLSQGSCPNHTHSTVSWAGCICIQEVKLNTFSAHWEA